MASIRRREGPKGISYQITVSRGIDVNGKRIRETTTYTPDQSLTPKKMEKAVSDFARDFEQKIENGESMDGHHITLKEFSERWLAEVVRPNMAPQTVLKYTEELNDKIIPALGHFRLGDLRPGTINKFMVSLTKDDARKDGKPGGYSKGSRQKTRMVLSSMLRTAAEWELILRNPCDRVRLKYESAADRIKHWTPAQAITFLDYIAQPFNVTIKGHQRIDDTGKPYTVPDYETAKTVPNQIQVLFNLALYTGMRKGELLALTWKDIDFKANQIRVSKSVTVVNGQVQIKEPKSRASIRTISIPAQITTQLQHLRAEQAEYRLKLGTYWQGDNWIFIQENGRMMNYGTPNHAMQDILKRYNTGKPEEKQLPLIPFHGCRHTSATLLIAAHQDIKTVSRRLGHSETSTTMNFYVHALADADTQAANALETILDKQAKNA